VARDVRERAVIVLMLEGYRAGSFEHFGHRDLGLVVLEPPGILTWIE
jgi:hypothetical protein